MTSTLTIADLGTQKCEAGHILPQFGPGKPRGRNGPGDRSAQAHSQLETEDGLHPVQHPTGPPSGGIGHLEATDRGRSAERRDGRGLPLAAKGLARLFPDLWRTRKAAEDWARKNPLRSLISIIRLWGVLKTYRPPGQTRWSKAVVRHGAVPRMALAAVLVRAGRRGHSGSRGRRVRAPR